MMRTMPPPPDAYAAAPDDRMRRHYDEVDAQALLRMLERDYEIHLRYEKCHYRRGLYHIELPSKMHEDQRGILVRYCDGYQPAEIARYYPDRTSRQISDSLDNLVHYAGLLSRIQLVQIVTYFGIVTPTVFLERGD